MEQRFVAILDKLIGADSATQCILAVSGGIDSVVMAYLFKVSTRPFSIAHCNFQLRGQESDKDEDFVKSLAEKLGVEIFIKRFETSNYAIERGMSIQMAARELRYEWFEFLARDNQAKLATAHHANDVAETMLFNLAKGTGIAGIHGIAESDGFVIRPMLWAKKYEFEAYADEHKIDWREDQSNESEKYMRNIIRLKVIPELERVNPSFVDASLRTTSRLKASEDFIHFAIEQLGLVEERDNDIYIKVEELKGLPGLESVLYQLIKHYGFNYDQAKSIEKSLGNSGAIFNTNEWTLNIDRDHLIISRQKDNRIEILIDREAENIKLESGNLNIDLYSSDDFTFNKNPEVAALDYDKLTFPLLLRNWRQGDFFVPLGMRGNKKISDFLIDLKISVTNKSKILVLLSEDEIVWVVGLRINEHYKITSQTKNIYQIKPA